MMYWVLMDELEERDEGMMLGLTLEETLKWHMERESTIIYV
jgi:hypothetical protein